VISYKDIALKIFLTVAKPLITVTYYLMAWLNKPDDSRQAWRHRWPALLTNDNTEQNSFYIHKMAI